MFRRSFQLALALACVCAGLPGLAPVRAAEVVGGQPIRWGYYVTYAADSLASLKANIDALTHVSPYYYALATDGTIDTRNEQTETTALHAAHGVQILPMIKNAATYDAFHALIDTPEEQDASWRRSSGWWWARITMGSTSIGKGSIRPTGR